jgi:hypothetical protein
MTMARRAKKKTQVAQKTQECVAVAFARDEAEAREYQALLTGDNIPATIRPHAESDNGSAGYSVMVPEEFVDKAYVIIESQDAYDDFYDLAIDDEADFDGDVFDDDI